MDIFIDALIQARLFRSVHFRLLIQYNLCNVLRVGTSFKWKVGDGKSAFSLGGFHFRYSPLTQPLRVFVRGELTMFIYISPSVKLYVTDLPTW